ncbi:sporulation-induced protein, partial [Dipsacomyces acuminosporus]
LISEYSVHDFEEDEDEEDDEDGLDDNNSQKNNSARSTNDAQRLNSNSIVTGHGGDAGSPPPSPPLSSHATRTAANESAAAPASSHAAEKQQQQQQGPRQYLLETLWGVMSLPVGELDALQATYFSRVLCGLLQRKPYETLDFIRAQDNAVTLFLRHISVSAVVDLLLKIISLEELDDGPGIIAWLSKYRLIPMLVDMLSPSCDPEIHSLSAQVLLDIIAISQCNNPAQPTIGTNALIAELKSEATVTRLANYMLDREAPHATSTLINCVYIFIELIRRNYSDADAEMSPEEQGGYGFGGFDNIQYDQQQAQRRLPTVDLTDMMKVLALRVKDLVELLKLPRSSVDPVPTTQGLREPLGFERLRICELFAELLHCSNMPRLNLLGGEDSRSSSGPADAEKPIDTSVDDGADDAAKSKDEGGEIFKDSPIINSKVSYAGISASEDSPKPEARPLSSSSSTGRPSPTVEVQHEVDGNVDGNVSAGEDNGSGGYPTIPLEISDPADHSTENTPVGQLLKWNLIRYNVLPVCTDLFFKFPLNNFLHSVVYDVMHQVLNLPLNLECNVALVVVAFRDVRVTSKIAQACAKNDEVCQEPKGVRLGYMGHLTGIGEEVARLLELSGASLEPLIAPYINGDEWMDYVARTLQEVRERDQQPLGGERPLGSNDIVAGDESSQVFVSRMGLVDPATGETFDPEEEEYDDDEDEEEYDQGSDKGFGRNRLDYNDEDDEDDEIAADSSSSSSSSSRKSKNQQSKFLNPSDLDDEENIDYINTDADIYFNRNRNFGLSKADDTHGRQFSLHPSTGDEDEDDEQYILKDMAASGSSKNGNDDDGEGIGPAGSIGRFHSYQNERSHQGSRNVEARYSDDDDDEDGYNGFDYSKVDRSRNASNPAADGSRRKVVFDDDDDEADADGLRRKHGDDDDDDEDDASEMGPKMKK